MLALPVMLKRCLRRQGAFAIHRRWQEGGQQGGQWDGQPYVLAPEAALGQDTFDGELTYNAYDTWKAH